MSRNFGSFPREARELGLGRLEFLAFDGGGGKRSEEDDCDRVHGGWYGNERSSREEIKVINIQRGWK